MNLKGTALVTLLLFLGFSAPDMRAQAPVPGTFNLTVKATGAPELGPHFHFSERLSARLLVGLLTSFDDIDGTFNLSGLYRLESAGAVDHYVGAGITLPSFDTPIFFGPLYGLRYRLTERFSVLGEMALDISFVGNTAVLTTLLNTGVGVSYQF